MTSSTLLRSLAIAGGVGTFVLSLAIAGGIVAGAEPKEAVALLTARTLAPADVDADSDPGKSREKEQAPTLDGAQALETMRAAARATHAGLRSAIAKARFTGWVRRWDDPEPQLVTDGRFRLYAADGSFHFKFTHNKMLRWTKNDLEGNTELIDQKPDNVFVVDDGSTIRGTVFSRRLHATGRGSWTLKHRQDAYRQVGIRHSDPTFLTQICDLEEIIASLGPDAFRITKLPGNGYRATYRLKNSPTARGEIDAYRKDGFNVSASRMFNLGEELPFQVEEAVWTKVNDQWVVKKLSYEFQYRGAGKIVSEREIISFYEIEVNPWVDPDAFTATSMDPNWSPAAAYIDEPSKP